ncbi:hypothetical protein V8F20_003264 [Naviculisporaceae sp. PSN 640]
MTGTYTIEVVPFAEYDWTFEKPGWINLNPAAVGLIAAFCGIAFWMSLELLVLVYLTFRQRRGLYFYSIIITTLGIILQTTGYLLKAFENPWPPVLVTIICKLGWVSNVTGFSLVLWARLHLVVRSPKTLRWILGMIVFNALTLHTPIVVFEFALMSHNPYIRQKFLYPMEIMERIQQTIFTLQEVIISGLYIYHTARFLNDGFTSRARKVVGLLIAVQIVAICFDAGLTAFDYMNMFTLKCTLHPFVYSVKLKLEFIVLNQLLTIVKKGLISGLRDGSIGILSSANRPGGRGGGEKADGKSGVAGGLQFVTEAPSMSSTGMNSGVTIGDQLDPGNEQCLSEVLGRPDSGVIDSSSEDNVKEVHTHDERYAADEIERQYLGRFQN